MIARSKGDIGLCWCGVNGDRPQEKVGCPAPAHSASFSYARVSRWNQPPQDPLALRQHGFRGMCGHPNISLWASCLCSKWPYLLSNLLSPLCLFSSKGKRLEQKRRLWKATRSHGKGSHDRQVKTKLEGVDERREWKEWRSVLCLNVVPARSTISNHNMQILGALPWFLDTFVPLF